MSSGRPNSLWQRLRACRSGQIALIIGCLAGVVLLGHLAEGGPSQTLQHERLLLSEWQTGASVKPLTRRGRIVGEIREETSIIEGPRPDADQLGYALLMRAEEYYQLDNRWHARSDLDRAMALGGKSPVATARVIEFRDGIAADRGDCRPYIADLDTMRRLDPEAWWTPYGRGLCYLRSGRADLALADFDAILAREPKERAEMLGKLGGSPADMGALIRRDMDRLDARFHAGRAEALRKLGRYDDARAAYDVAVREDPANWKWLSGRGWTNFHAGNFGAAWDDFARATWLKFHFARATRLTIHRSGR